MGQKKEDLVLDVFTPNKTISKSALRILVGTQLAFFLVVWALSPFVFLPKPIEVVHAFGFLWTQEGLGGELITSFSLNLEALCIGTIVSLALAYLSVLPFFRPVVAFIGKLRFLSLAGLSFFFTIMASNGHELKVSLLTFSIAVFLVTSMADVIASVPKEQFDLARTLRMNEWRTTVEVVILGRFDQALVAIRSCAAMGWMLMSMVESISREGGGVGALLIDQNKHFHLDAVFAIQIAILSLGLLQDYAIGLIRNVVCPYASLTLERK